MREVAFIAQNKQYWLNVEQIVNGKSSANPDQLVDIYNKLLNDLSFARTYYPKSKLVYYLNYLSSNIHLKIYRKKRHDFSRIVTFFSREVPLIAYRYRKTIYFTFAVFFVIAAIGVLSAIKDEEFIRYVLGDEYVDKTIENIENGNPVSIYKSGSDWGSFIGIAFNNLRVGAYMYFAGMLFGLGTFYILFSNAMMLGAFQTMFYIREVLLKSVQGIWIHGSMEIFGMVIEAAMGFALAASFMFPGTYSRKQSFKIGFKNTFKVYLSTIPFTIMAAFLEGYVTRFALEMGVFWAFFIIILTLGFITFYYLIYPRLVFSKTQFLQEN
jgi:uncharacterized membrane protein SpoIIM required for sporulation